MMRYARIQKWLHWLIALAVIAVLGAGLTLGRFGFEGMEERFGLEATNLVYKYHKTFGILILAAMLARVAARLRFGKPAYDPPLTAFERRASAAVHTLLYLCLLAMPILGWTATAASDFPIEFFGWRLPGLIAVNKPLGETLYALHGWVGRALLVLILVHFAAAFRHAIVKRDGVLSRML